MLILCFYLKKKFTFIFLNLDHENLKNKNKAINNFYEYFSKHLSKLLFVFFGPFHKHKLK